MSESMGRGPALRHTSERPAATTSGYLLLVVMLAALIGAGASFGWIDSDPALAAAGIVTGVVVATFILCGFYMIQPNQAVAITLFGEYKGTDRNAGLRWLLPWLIRKKLSLRANNIISERIKVNDLRGNPIEMAAQVVWRVTDTAQALFDVDDYKAFVNVQIEAA